MMTSQDPNTIMSQQQDTMFQLQSLLEQSTQSLLCGPTCQAAKTQSDLKQQFIAAQTNAETAPAQLQQSRRDYLVSVYGEAAFHEMRQQELRQEADRIAAELTSKFHDQLQHASMLGAYYQSSTTYISHAKELYNMLLAKHRALKQKLQSAKESTTTANRKTYYETELVQSLQSKYTLLWYIYYLIALGIIIRVVATRTQRPFPITLGLIVGALVLPYWRFPVARWLWRVLRRIHAVILPKLYYGEI